MAQFAGSAHWAEPSSLFAYRARPNPFNCKNEYLVLALGKETAVHAVVGSIIWAFRWPKKPECWKMSNRGYALHYVCPIFLLIRFSVHSLSYSPFQNRVCRRVLRTRAIILQVASAASSWTTYRPTGLYYWTVGEYLKASALLFKLSRDVSKQQFGSGFTLRQM